MESMNGYINEYKQQMEKGVIQKAYKGLMEYIMSLRTHFSNKYPDLTPGNLYHGYMDMTYFPIFPRALKSRKLKIAIVVIHETIRFEAWLVGYNKQIQTEYWKLLKEVKRDNYRMPATLKGVDSIIECTLADNPDFSDPDGLTKQIEDGTLTFISDIEGFLSKG
jgi:hypothetical protein